MRREQGRSLAEEIEGIRDGVEHWRRTRLKRSPMPEDLWQDAASLARVHGVYAIARDLRLSYESLKKRAAQSPGGGRGRKRRPADDFVELSGAQIFGASASLRTVELSDGDGARLAVRLADGDELDVLGLVESFWSRHG